VVQARLCPSLLWSCRPTHFHYWPHYAADRRSTGAWICTVPLSEHIVYLSHCRDHLAHEHKSLEVGVFHGWITRCGNISWNWPTFSLFDRVTADRHMYDNSWTAQCSNGLECLSTRTKLPWFNYFIITSMPIRVSSWQLCQSDCCNATYSGRLYFAYTYSYKPTTTIDYSFLQYLYISTKS